MSLDRFKTLRYRLMESQNWPLNYMFKFVAPNQNGNVDRIKALLPDHGKLSFKHTASLNHVSVTCIALMDNADQIIEITEQIDRIEGVIVL